MNNNEEWQKVSAEANLNTIKKATSSEGAEASSVSPNSNKGEMSKILSGLSTIKKVLMVVGMIIFLGIVFFVAFSWSDIESFSRIVVTLGMGILFTGAGSVLLQQVPKDHIDVGTALHAVGGILMPVGIFVTMSEFGTDPTSFWTTSTVFGFVFLFYLLLSYVHRRTVIYFFTIAHGTASVYLLTEALTQNMEQNNLYLYLNIVVGIIYLILSYWFRNSWNNVLLGTLNLFGTAGIFGFAFMLLMQSQIWEVIYVILALIAIFLSTRVKSTVVLIISTTALVAYIAYMTKQYLVIELGWPISILVAIVISLLLGYISLVIHKKFIRRQ